MINWKAIRERGAQMARTPRMMTPFLIGMVIGILLERYLY